MTLDFLLPATLGLVLIAAFVGYGSAIKKILFRGEDIGWANEAAWGVAFVIALSGFLGYVTLFSRNTVNAILIVGFVLMLFEKLPRLMDSVAGQISNFTLSGAGRGVVVVPIIVLVSMLYAYSVNLAPVALSDDLKSYFAFPKQLIEMGGFNVDPFDSFRMANGLGGQSALHALVLANADVNSLMLIDAGVALIICTGLVWRLCADKKFSVIGCAAFVLFFLLLPLEANRINSSSLVTGMIMFLALFSFLDRKALNDATPVRNALVVAMLAAAACALKSNLIPSLFMALGVSYLWHVYATRSVRHAWIETILVPLFVMALLLPWMLSLNSTSGSLLYPTLGTGFDESNYGAYVDEGYAGGLSLSEKLGIIVERFFLKDINLLLLITSVLVFLVIKPGRRAASHALILGALLGSVFMLLKFDLSNLAPFFRYTFVSVTIAFLVGLIELSSFGVTHLQRNTNTNPHSSAWLTENWRYKLALVGTVAIIWGFIWHFGYGHRGREYFKKIYAELPQATRRSLIPEAEYARHKEAQAAVPAGEAIFSRDLYTLLYDYGRNRIFNINDPGMASPPPGMPYAKSAEEVSAYLQSHGIRYVAYHYEDQAGYPVVKNLWRHDPARPYMHRVSERSKVALDHVLGELGVSRKRVFDDGTLFVVDLQSPVIQKRELNEPNYFQLGKILVPVWAETIGFDSRKIWTYGHAEIRGITYDIKKEDSLLAINTFSYHPWKDDLEKLNLVVSVNGTMIPFVRHARNSYFYSLASIKTPITSISIDSSSFDPNSEPSFNLARYYKGEKKLGVDIDTIQIVQ